ncbi:polysaccharide deacetylase family protein [Tropicibacter sp. Alg240-R139]|uniref:polysaccharide deacetylase family protein n=1 Tax=Tropicibacter sp. Alg240-R139 TaxID=2305991 RepID=UPI0013DE9102|nr:polysaccharide deacetylase family protein [Tropicibacter sp. Alg240-R139]
MTPDWSPLERELALWWAEGKSLPLWWRDDDAVEPTAALDRLGALSEELSIPVHLAVVPAYATETLSERLAPSSGMIPVVHGWAHQNHAPALEKKAEFRMHRPVSEITADAERGLSRSQAMFGSSLMPMFVPPWNRIDHEIVEGLPSLGYKVLSTATPRKRPFATPGLWQINTHLDPIDWRGTRGLVPEDQLISQLVQHLQDRRTGVSDNAEPYGLLTHHLVHDQDIWRFTREVLLRLLDGPTRCWTMAETLEKDPTP